MHDNPKSIIVLDAFEKADNVIQNNLLSIFEGGEMRDACGWDKMTDMPCSDDDAKVYDEGNANYIVDFRQTIFIITSSLGKELYSDNRFIKLVEDDYIQAESMILDALKREEKPNIQNGVVSKKRLFLSYFQDSLKLLSFCLTSSTMWRMKRLVRRHF